MEKLRTGISKAYWCEPNNDGKWAFKPAYIPAITKSDQSDQSNQPNQPNQPNQVAWLDVLLEGGIVIPDWALDSNKNHRALTMLVSGPPGVGKSTFVFELVYRLSHSSDSWHTVYVSTETSVDGLRHQAIEHGWFHRDSEGVLKDDSSRREEIEKMIHPYGKVHKPEDRLDNHIDVFEETEEFSAYFKDDKQRSSSRSVRLIESLIKVVTKMPVNQVTQEINGIRREATAKNVVTSIKPDILVIDSLNTVGQDERGELFTKFLRIRQLVPKLIIIVLDCESIHGNSNFWAYACDIVFHLDRVYPQGYMVRTLEVVKARYQPHVWGVHQLKIYGAQSTEPSSDQKEVTKLKRAHPYREEGGVFIYPSIHFVLSKYKRLSHADKPDPIPVVPKKLNSMLNKGLPKWRCTGFVGMRGGHKSHLGYLNLLSRVINVEKDKPIERALVVSLRDDEGMARKTMQSILNDELNRIPVESLENSNLLEILHYPPGYITPEEFFHRMMLSVHRLKNASPESQVTVLFNSLDQLGSRFPLCANLRIFVPGIIEALCAEQVTSIFIGVQEPGQPPEQYGLLSMADLILSFNRCRFKYKDYTRHVLGEKSSYNNLDIEECEAEFKSKRGKNIDCIVVRVQRFAGGQAAGAGGILELIDANDSLVSFYGKPGLFFAKLSPLADQGVLVDSDGVPRSH